MAVIKLNVTITSSVAQNTIFDESHRKDYHLDLPLTTILITQSINSDN